MKTLTTETLVQRLTHLGMATYALLATLIWLVPADLHPFIAIALTSFAAVNAGFLGGIHWGIGLRGNTPHGRHHITWSIVATFIAWVAVVMPAYAGLPLLGLLLVACYAIDHKTWADAGLGHWLQLRQHSTVVAVVGCLLGAAGT